MSKYIVVFTPTGSEDLSAEDFDSHEKALAFVTGDGDSGLDFDISDDKAVIVDCVTGKVEWHT